MKSATAVRSKLFSPSQNSILAARSDATRLRYNRTRLICLKFGEQLTKQVNPMLFARQSPLRFLKVLSKVIVISISISPERDRSNALV